MYAAREFYSAQGMSEYVPKDIYASLRSTAVARPRRVLSFLTIALPLSIFWLLLSYDRLPSFSPPKGPACTAATHWRGWSSVENMIVLYATNSFIHS